jgi:hypothetical protein
MRFADGRPADALTLPFIVDAAPPAVLELGVSSTTIELTVHVRARPAPGWLACRTSTRFVSGGYHEEDFEAWDSTGVLVAQSRQLALVRPLGPLSLSPGASMPGRLPWADPFRLSRPVSPTSPRAQLPRRRPRPCRNERQPPGEHGRIGVARVIAGRCMSRATDVGHAASLV